MMDSEALNERAQFSHNRPPEEQDALQEREALNDFKSALGGEVVDLNLEHPGGLSTTEILATRSWFDQRLARLEAARYEGVSPEMLDQIEEAERQGAEDDDPMGDWYGRNE